MSVHTRKHLTKKDTPIIVMQHAGISYQIPVKIAEKYRVNNESINASDLFDNINKKYIKPGALLKGIRVRENLTPIQLAKLLGVTQSDISQMEHGVRKIGRKIAQRVEKLFSVGYRAFLD